MQKLSLKRKNLTFLHLRRNELKELLKEAKEEEIYIKNYLSWAKKIKKQTEKI